MYRADYDNWNCAASGLWTSKMRDASLIGRQGEGTVIVPIGSDFTSVQRRPREHCRQAVTL